MMPFIAFFSTILIGWIVTPDYVIDEMERSGDKFRRKKENNYDVYIILTVYRNSALEIYCVLVFLSPLICGLFLFHFYQFVNLCNIALE